MLVEVLGPYPEFPIKECKRPNDCTKFLSNGSLKKGEHSDSTEYHNSGSTKRPRDSTKCPSSASLKKRRHSDLTECPGSGSNKRLSAKDLTEMKCFVLVERLASSDCNQVQVPNALQALPIKQCFVRLDKGEVEKWMQNDGNVEGRPHKKTRRVSDSAEKPKAHTRYNVAEHTETYSNKKETGRHRNAKEGSKKKKWSVCVYSADAKFQDRVFKIYEKHSNYNRLELKEICYEICHNDNMINDFLKELECQYKAARETNKNETEATEKALYWTVVKLKTETITDSAKINKEESGKKDPSSLSKAIANGLKDKELHSIRRESETTFDGSKKELNSIHRESETTVDGSKDKEQDSTSVNGGSKTGEEETMESKTTVNGSEEEEDLTRKELDFVHRESETTVDDSKDKEQDSTSVDGGSKTGELETTESKITVNGSENEEFENTFNGSKPEEDLTRKELYFPPQDVNRIAGSKQQKSEYNFNDEDRNYSLQQKLEELRNSCQNSGLNNGEIRCWLTDSLNRSDAEAKHAILCTCFGCRVKISDVRDAPPDKRTFPPTYPLP